jgi:hypothetical protein
MTTLTDTQLVILSQAAQRKDAGVILPERLKGNAARTTVSRLIARGLIEEVRVQGSLPVWRQEEEAISSPVKASTGVFRSAGR